MDVAMREVVAVIEDFESRLRSKRAVLDDLNVFPVADSDTGSNMVRTLASVRAAIAEVEGLDGLARRVADAALDGRGNSGLIVGQFLAGFTSVAAGDQLPLELGLAEAARWARRAVAAPVEGTMLTVADVAAASYAVGGGLDSVLLAVNDAVASTPMQLPVLAERGVVDSGAAGLELFFQSLCAVLETPVLDETVVDETVLDDSPQPDRAEALIVCNVGMDAPLDAVVTPSAYEVQFRLPVGLIDRAALENLLTDLGTDIVIAASESELAAHVHVDDPHSAAAAISAAIESRPGAKAISYEIEPITETDEAEPTR